MLMEKSKTILLNDKFKANATVAKNANAVKIIINLKCEKNQFTRKNGEDL